MASVLLHLSAHKQSLKTRRLLRKLEQLLPFILRQERLLLLRANRVLLLALLLPLLNLGLLAREGALVVLGVVLLGLVVFDALEELVAGFLQEGVDGEVEAVEVRGQRVGRDVGVVGEIGEGGGEVEGGLFWGGLGQVVEEGGEEVGVVDCDGELDEDVLVAEVGFLDAGGGVSI